jgi:kumamolisin
MGAEMSPEQRDGHPGFLPHQVLRAYGATLPSVRRPHVAIISLGGGYLEADLVQAWNAMGMPLDQRPVLSWVSISGRVNSPGSSDDFENALDIQTIGGLGNVDITVVFAPPTDVGMYDALQFAITHGFSVVSVSWGAFESQWPVNGLNTLSALVTEAAGRGVSVFFASGDTGAVDGLICPACVPNGVAVGGTTLVCPTLVYEDATTVETGWHGSGGGVSQVFDGRNNPDVAAVADPATGMIIYVSSVPNVAPGFYFIGGTSAAAPIWAAIWAAMGPLNTFARPTLANASAVRDILVGDTVVYLCGPGYDLVTGSGTPNVPYLVSLAPTPTLSPTPTLVPGAAGALLPSLFLSFVLVLVVCAIN